MIMRGGTPRSLSAAGFFLVVALGAVLLPLVPSWAQQSAPSRPDTEQPPPGTVRDYIQAPAQESPQRSEGVRSGDEVSRVGDQVRESQRQVERARAELRRAEQRLSDAIELKARAAEEHDRFTHAGRSPGYGAPPPGQPGFPRDLAARLDHVERKLDAVLEELHSLRRELRRGPSGYGLPGGPPAAGSGRFAPAGGALPGGPSGLAPAVPAPAQPGVAAPPPPAGASPAPPAIEVPETPSATPVPPGLPGTPGAPVSPPAPVRSTPPSPGKTIGL